MTDRNESEPLPESAMGGASDAGAHGMHPASAARVEHPLPEEAPGDAAIERRHQHNPGYRGPERRLGATANRNR